jgi:hypothetical protein
VKPQTPSAQPQVRPAQPQVPPAQPAAERDEEHAAQALSLARAVEPRRPQPATSSSLSRRLCQPVVSGIKFVFFTVPVTIITAPASLVVKGYRWAFSPRVVAASAAAAAEDDVPPPASRGIFSRFLHSFRHHEPIAAQQPEDSDDEADAVDDAAAPEAEDAAPAAHVEQAAPAAVHEENDDPAEHNAAPEGTNP